jgi:hypothetical protein
VVIETADEFIARKNSDWSRVRTRPVRTKDIGREGSKTSLSSVSWKQRGKACGCRRHGCSRGDRRHGSRQIRQWDWRRRARFLTISAADLKLAVASAAASRTA